MSRDSCSKAIHRVGNDFQPPDAVKGLAGEPIGRVLARPNATLGGRTWAGRKMS